MRRPPRWAALLDRYLSGKATPTEEAALRQWLGEDFAGGPLTELLEAARTRVAEGLPDVDAAAAFAHVDARITASDEPTTVSADLREAAHRRLMVIPGAAAGSAAHAGERGRRWSHEMSPRVIAAVAAGLIVAIGLTTVWRSRVPYRDTPVVVATAREYVAPRAQRVAVTLADGTEFTLAPASRLVVPANFAIGNRTVTLDGEALFSVVHDPAHPFRVRTAAALTEDVGTRFAVRAYADETGTRVVVADGEVIVSTGSTVATPAHLRPGDLAMVQAGAGLTVQHGVAVHDYLAWANGDLVFRKMPLRQVAGDLGRRYDLDVRVSDSVLGSRLITASFNGDTPAKVLSVLALILDARVEQHGRTVTLAPSTR